MLGREKYTQQNQVVPGAKCLWGWVGYWKAKKSHITRYWSNPSRSDYGRGRTIRFEIHKFIISIWNKEELPEEWKESIILPIYKKGNKTDCSNHRGVSFLPVAYKILSNILLSRLTPCAEKIIWGSSTWISTQQVKYW